MALRKIGWIACLAGVALYAWPGVAQTPPQTRDDALHQLSQMADVIFSGQVVAVRHHAGAGGSTGVVEIDFAVADAVRGVSGATYTLREWAGLWVNGEPFKVGQRYLVLLHAPGPAGLSSPVGGMDGAIPIRGDAPAFGPGRTAANDSSSGAKESNATEGRIADLRWVEARVVRPISYSTPTAARPITVHAALAGSSSQDTNGITSNEPRHSTSYADVIGMLRGWEVTDRGAH